MSTASRCFACFRPTADCFCATIPTIDNQTEVLILQHRRERRHPFNTARIVRKALRNATYLVDHVGAFAKNLPLREGAGLLYPGDDARLVDDLGPHERPRQLVVVDGTWHHTKTMLRDVPALRELPRLRLAPTEASRYRIRREPTAEALSTLEAVVAALRVLEPGTSGLDQLVEAFTGMIDRQLLHPRKVPDGWRSHARRRRTAKNIPTALLDGLGNVVAAYGEAWPHVAGETAASQQPAVWVAERLSTGETFRCLIRDDQRLSDAALAHWELTESDFAAAVTREEARRRWEAFLRPDDRLTVYNEAVARLAARLSPSSTKPLVLKSVNLAVDRTYRDLDEVIAAAGLVVAAPRLSARAGRRLANLVSYVRHLHRAAGD
jgi:DTW domain-containing protein YfiP